jgi:hypothetical protein
MAIDPVKALNAAVHFLDAIKDAYPTEDEQIGTYTLIVRCVRDGDGDSTVYVGCVDHNGEQTLLDTSRPHQTVNGKPVQIVHV